ncbi:MAG TPA: VIT domain-containing protein, partial [Minicystis sp.]|nr:VIT domain-containing protein [Minicystis sp.]
RARKPGDTKEKDHAVRLAKHSAKVRIVDLVARTEIDETFTNDTDQELEGIFRFPLPQGAQIERLALEVDGKLVDGAFVDRDKGAAIWRGVIHNAAPKAPKPKEEIFWVPGPWRDPALLEWQRGGRFELKIFPIPKHGSRRVVLAYTQVVDQAAGLRRFVLPLAHDATGTTRVDHFDVDVQILGADPKVPVETRGYELASATNGAAIERSLHADGFVPAGDLTVEYALPGRDKEVTAWAYAPPPSADNAVAAAAAEAAPPRRASVGSKSKAKSSAAQKAADDAARTLVDDPSPYVAIALRPKLPRWGEAEKRAHVIVVDASRSMFGERFARATRLAASIVREMDRRDTFALLACDTTCRPMKDGGATEAPGAAAAEEVERFLSQIEPDGGSDLAEAVKEARGVAGAARDARILYLGDGTPTVGPTKPAHLELATRQLVGPDAAVVAVALGADADTASLEALARGGGGVLVPYAPGQRVNAAALDVLAAAYGQVLRDPEIELPAGLADVTPARLDPIRAGGEAIVVARMTGHDARGSLKLRGRVGGERFEQSYPLEIIASTSAGNAFVPRLYAAAKIAELERDGGDAAKPLAIALSRRFDVASRFTSLLVLESEAMFKAFGVDHPGAARVGAFTGEDAADSTSADGDLALAGDDESAGGDKDDGVAEKKKNAGRLGGSHRAKEDANLAQGAPAGHHASVSGGGFVANADAAASAAPTTAAPSAAPAEEPAGKAAEASPPPPAPTPRRAQAQGGLARNPFGGEGRGPAGAPAKKPADDAFLRREHEVAMRRRGFVPMKKVFDRKTSFDTIDALAAQSAGKLVAAEAALRAAPDSRDRTVELFALYATSNRLGEAQELTARWAGRDALDPDALLARADLAARQGDRERAVRILGGLVDVRPNDRATQARLADLFDAEGQPARACEHRIAIAEIAANETKPVADAVRCARAEGLVDLASRLELDAGEKIRTAIEVASASTPPARPFAGDVQVT